MLTMEQIRSKLADAAAAEIRRTDRMERPGRPANAGAARLLRNFSPMGRRAWKQGILNEVADLLDCLTDRQLRETWERLQPRTVEEILEDLVDAG